MRKIFAATSIPSLLVCLALITSAPVAGQEGNLAFLRIGTSAAGAALGDTYVALSQDAFSTFWNPAGLAGAASNSTGVTYHAWVGNVQTYAAAARFRAGDAAGVGIFLTASGSGDLEVRTEPGRPEGTFGVQFVSTGVSYARRLGPIRGGVTAKYISEHIFTERAHGYGFDAGLQAELYDGDVRLGAALQHAGKMSELSVEASRLPRTLRAGAAIFPLRITTGDDNSRVLRVMATAEIVHIFPSSTTQLHFGSSLHLIDLIEFRAGFISNDPLRKFTAGAGIGFEGFVFDYAFLPFETGFEGPGHILTLTYHW